MCTQVLFRGRCISRHIVRLYSFMSIPQHLMAANSFSVSVLFHSRPPFTKTHFIACITKLLEGQLIYRYQPRTTWARIQIYYRLPGSSPTRLRRHELDLDPILVVFVLSFPHLICPSIGTCRSDLLQRRRKQDRTHSSFVHLWSGDELGTKCGTSKVILHLASGEDTAGAQPGAHWVVSRECTR